MPPHFFHLLQAKRRVMLTRRGLWTPQALVGEVICLLEDEKYQKRMMTGFAEIREILGISSIRDRSVQESASMRVAWEIAAYF